MKYGFIGCGNMGSSIARALAGSTVDFMVTDRSGRARQLAEELGVRYGDNQTAASECNRLFLAVKPQMMESVLGELQPVLAEKKPVLISMAAGMDLTRLQTLAGTDLPVLRIMPNTPVAVGRGLILYCGNDRMRPEVTEDIIRDLRHAGRFDPVEEKLFEASGTLTGCGPAYVYVFLEALADGAVACGVPRAKAMEYGALMVAGAAEMAREAGTNPAALKDAVCSPVGSTIAGVKALEDRGFRGAVMESVMASFRRNLELGK